EILEGSSPAIGSGNFRAAADIGWDYFSVLLQASISTPDVNEWLTIRNLLRGFFKWWPICRRDSRESSVSEPGPA
ncbi:MAG: hypothetical protein WCA28_09020, partial [Bradyrhizobium sp.]